MSASRPLFIAACLILALLIGGVALTRAPDNGAVLTTGKALVGGPFKLTDQNGRAVTDQDFKGRPFLVFFGFTNCPDICPTTMHEISAVFRALGPYVDRQHRGVGRLGASGGRLGGGGGRNQIGSGFTPVLRRSPAARSPIPPRSRPSGPGRRSRRRA